MRILVIRRDNIGDLVCTTPLLAALRARFPGAHIAALVNSYNAAVLEGNPSVDAVHSYTKLKHRLPGQSRLGILGARLGTLVALRRQSFDYVVLAKAGFDRHGFNFARQLRRRDVVGFVPAGGAPPSLTRPVAPIEFDALHEVEIMARLGRALDVPDALGPLRVYPSESRRTGWRARLGDPVELRIGVHISAREPSRVWPTERWIELIRHLATENAVRIVLLWSPGDADDPRHPGDDAKAAAIQRAVPVLAAPTRELADLIAVLSLCRAFVGADGGAMHVAAGLGLPMVALFENLDSKKRRWHPWGVTHELVAPATRDIADIRVAQMVDAWQALRRRARLESQAAAY